MATKGMHLKAIHLHQDQGQLPVSNNDFRDADWKEIYEKVARRDFAMMKDYDSEIDTLLVFAGLFSAVLTAFIIDVYKDLDINYAKDSATTLRQIFAQLEGVESSALSSPSASPSPAVILVIVLWFVSLVLSLLSALFSIFIKQWLHTYDKWTEVAQINFQEGLILRGFYQTSFNSWKIPEIFMALGVLLQIGLVFFVIGLVAYLWTLNFVVSSVLSFFALTMISLSALVLGLPVIYETCPYKSPFAYGLLKVRTQSSERDWTERDLPIAKRQLRLDEQQPSLARAIALTALLLDVAPSQLELAISPSKSDDPSVSRTIELVRDRVHDELSAESTALLSSIVTSSTILQGNLVKNDVVQLLGLWKITLGCMARAPTTIFHALRYLEARITPGNVPAAGDYLSNEYVQLLVTHILPQCCNLSEQVADDTLATELSRVALAVRNWAEASSPIGPFNAAEMSLKALMTAASCIPSKAPETGISPVTPYLSLLDALGDAAERIVGSRYDPIPGNIETLHQEATQRRNALIDFHASFLCTQCRGFKTATTEEPRRVFFSNDSLHLFVGTDETAAWIVDIEEDQGSVISTASLPNGPSFHYAHFTPDGQRVYWGSRQGPLCSVSMTTGESVRFEGAGSSQRSYVAAVSHDEAYLLVASESNSAALCDATTGEIVMTFEGHSKRICKAAFAPVLPPRKVIVKDTSTDPAVPYEPPMEPERPHLATTSCDNTVRIWDVDTGSCIGIFDDLGSSVNDVKWSPDATMLAITSSSIVRVYETTTRTLTCTLDGHTKLVCGIAFSPNGQLLASASNDHTVRVWNIPKRTCITVLTGPTDEVNMVAFSADGRFIAAAADDGVWIWDVNPCSVHRTTDGIQARAQHMTFRNVVERIIRLQRPFKVSVNNQ